MVLPPNVGKKGVRGNGRGHLTNEWIVGILRSDKGKESDPIESRVVRASVIIYYIYIIIHIIYIIY